MKLSIQNNEQIEELADKIIDVFGLSTSQSEQKTKVINLINDELYRDFTNVTLKTIIENYLKPSAKVTKHEETSVEKAQTKQPDKQTPKPKDKTTVKSPFATPARSIDTISEPTTTKTAKAESKQVENTTPEISLSMDYSTEEPTEEPTNNGPSPEEPKLTLQSMIDLNKPQNSNHSQPKKATTKKQQETKTASRLSLDALNKLNQPTIEKAQAQTTKQTSAKQVLTDKSPIEFLQENPNTTVIPYNHHEYQLSHTVIKKGIDRGRKLYVLQYHLTNEINELVKQNLQAITETVDQLNPYPNGQYLMKYNENHALCFVISDYEHLNERVNALDTLIESIEQNLNRSI